MIHCALVPTDRWPIYIYMTFGESLFTEHSAPRYRKHRPNYEIQGHPIRIPLLKEGFKMLEIKWMNYLPQVLSPGVLPRGGAYSPQPIRSAALCYSLLPQWMTFSSVSVPTTHPLGGSRGPCMCATRINIIGKFSGYVLYQLLWENIKIRLSNQQKRLQQNGS